MEHGRTNLTEAVRSVQLFKIDDCCATAAMEFPCIKSEWKWSVDGHRWKVHFYPKHPHYHGRKCSSFTDWVALKLVLLSKPQRNNLRANLSCQLVDPSQRLNPSAEKSVSHVFCSRSKSSPGVLVMPPDEFASSGYLVNDSVTVECAITVLRDLPLPMPSSDDLHQHLSELLQSHNGADVTFHVSGESFAAHKAILAARSPVFKAEFFGGMGETSSKPVEIEDMEAAVFSAMLHFIYTDMAPELDEEQEPEAAATMAQHLLAASDRYGLNKLKLICEGKLAGGIDIDTTATMLALADQYSCSLLKAKCLEFITKSPETLDAVLATDGYNHLVASCPLVLTELVLPRAARRRKI